MVSQSQDIIFLDEPEPSTTLKATKAVKILTVDDDINFQRSTAFALSTLTILGAKIELTQAFSYAEACQMVANEDDFAIALVDVVMETEDAGLRLVRGIREVLGNEKIRIILLTGQPGMAPVFNVMRDYDINDYWTKSELSADRLQTILTTNLRSYQQISNIANAKRGLQLIAESSGALYTSRNIKELSSKMLQQLAILLNLPSGGIVCVKAINDLHEFGHMHQIIGASGEFESYYGKALQQLEQQHIRIQLELCLSSKHSRIESQYTCLFFPGELAGNDYAVYLATGRLLDATETELIRVFSMNICGGLHSVSLMSQLDKIAFEDPLLKIPNRNVLIRTLDGILKEDIRDKFNLLLIDIDKFSDFNHVFGSEHGNNMLKHVANSLKDQFDASVLVSRLKDDKFAILGPKHLVSATLIEQLFVAPYQQGTSCITVNISTVTLPLELAEGDAVAAITQLNMALKKAKSLGIRQHVTYQPSKDDVATHFELLQALQLGITQGDIHIALQPQVSLQTGEVVGVEALARWTLPNGDSVPPLRFIPIAEATGLITKLGKQLFVQSCQAMHALTEAGYPNLRIGVNLSAMQFEQEQIVNQLNADIQAAQIASDQIEIEVTESIAMQNFEVINKQLKALRNMNINVAIDDFGTGFSSLAYLSKLTFDRIKIDKSFIDNVTTDDGAAAIVDSIILLGERFKMNVIAEGVETLEQARWLKHRGCHDAQGYFYAKPMPLKELLIWLANFQKRIIE
ncbi:EAL domain-containing protein [Shewanella bicestrii]